MDDDGAGVLREESKSAGLWRMPSIAAPSWLFHETTSSVLVMKGAVCVCMSGSFFGLASVAAATKHLRHRPGVRAEKRDRRPSRESVKLEPTDVSRGRGV